MCRLAPVLSAAILGLTASPALAGTLDQSQTDGSDSVAGVGSGGDLVMGTSGTLHQGQSFTAGLSGALDQADLYLERACANAISDLSVQIRTVSGNPALPTSTVLASATVPAASVPAGSAGSGLGWVAVHFPTPATVNAGTRYALVAASTASCALPPPALVAITGYDWGLDLHDPYGGGTRLRSSDAGGSWSSQGGEDFAFKTYVVPPPLHPTTSELSCRPAFVELGSGSTICTVTVTDAGAPPVPGGDVAFESDGAGAYDGDGTCTLAPLNATQASCEVEYIPSAVGSGNHQITATYEGDLAHEGSQAATSIGVTAPQPPDPGPGNTGGTGTGTTGTGTGTTTATGQRAAALKKCKKKRGAARSKCKRSANGLPV